MKKLCSIVFFFTCILLMSCDVMQGAFAGMGGYGYGGNQFNPWNYYNGPAPQWSSGNTFTTVPVTTTTVPVQSYSGGISSSSSSTTSGGSSSNSNGHTCRLCNGTGKKISEVYMGTFDTRKWCDICKKEVYITHKHVSCDLCGGDGWIN